MKKLFLIKNPELFQGEKYLRKKKNYFEGWYFKNTNEIEGIAFIPGISIDNGKEKAFIQIITNDLSYYVCYDIDDFEFRDEPFYIKIRNNYFSMKRIHIDIDDDKQNLSVYGDIEYSDGINIDNSKFSPNIMGPFAYIPFMECNHAILKMKNKINGLIKINDKEIEFDNGNGYIEKDFGSSFPKSYIWCQGNNFNDDSVSFMISIADIPFKIFNFRGIICSLIIDNKEYRFATYNNTKIIKYEVYDNSLEIILKKDDYYLKIKSKYGDGLKLVAPVKGKMKKEIIESITEKITVTLKKNDEVIFSDTSRNCGMEIVLE